ncbi:unnamed protein product [Peniophora sp. CBMAI 1063]|nr:unnamed protein product [Peniophora sp. CBMAI 1063]
MTFAYGRLVSSTLYAGPTSPTSRWFSPHKLAPRPIPKARQTRTNSIESLNPSARGAESGVVSDVHSDQRGNRGTNTRGANRPATRIDPNQDQAAGDCDDTRPEFTVKIRSGHTMANPLEALRKLDSYLDQVEAHRLFYLKAPGLGYLVKMTRPEKERLRGLCPKTLRVVITEEPPLFAQ